MAKCFHCNSCLKPANIDNRLYIICKLCKSIYLPPETKGGSIKEISDEGEKKSLWNKISGVNIID